MEKCQRCNELDDDRRTLWMSCFYEMDELKIPFKHELVKTHIQDDGKKFYTLRVCKDCRSDWMKSIENWFVKGKQNIVSVGSGIFVREFGANVEISEEEFHRRNPGQFPVRIIEE